MRSEKIADIFSIMVVALVGSLILRFPTMSISNSRSFPMESKASSLFFPSDVLSTVMIVSEISSVRFLYGERPSGVRRNFIQESDSCPMRSLVDSSSCSIRGKSAYLRFFREMMSPRSEGFMHEKNHLRPKIKLTNIMNLITKMRLHGIHVD